MKNRQIITLIMLFFFSWESNVLDAQQLNRLEVPFTVNNELLLNPLVGGMNGPQFSEVDLNDDGIMDLVAFDRIGDVLLPFLNGGTPDKVDYTFAPEFIDQFPKLNNWVLLRDFNGDGIMDIFGSATTPGIPGVDVFQGRIENGKIAFDKIIFYEHSSGVIPFELANGTFTNVYVSAQDLPAIDDIDGDGDLDIVTFSVTGGYIDLYDNQSVELGYGTDSLKYILKTDCFGGLYESGLETCVCLADEAGSCCDGFQNTVADTRHAGSTLLTFDADGDGDKELMLGDISFNELVFLTNAGNAEVAFFNDQDCTYPSYDEPAFIPSFPAAFYLDVNNDGKKDLLAVPNAPSNSEDFFNVWYYKNTNNNTNPVFDLQQKQLLVEEMLDMGTGSNPTFVDYNQDGLMDLVVGTHTFYKPLGERDPRLFLYQNVGTKTVPHFELVDEDYLGYAAYGSTTNTFSPTFGDLDNDGDLDLLVGEQAGKLLYQENIAGAGNIFEFGPIAPAYFDIDVGQISVPQIVDINRDGLPDLVVGERNGNLNYFPNIGTASEPMFHPAEEEAPNNDFFGQVDVRELGFISGYASPVFVDFEGTYVLFCGSESGYIRQYTNIDDNLNGIFTLKNARYGGGIDEGERTHPTFYDLDGDEVLDIFIGNYRGGVSSFVSDLAGNGGTVSTQYLNNALQLNIFPNPAQDQITLSINRMEGRTAKVIVYNTIGQQVLQQETQDPRTSIGVSDLAAGLYLCEVRIGSTVKIEKFLVR